MDIEVNYKDKTRYKTGRTPWHQNKFWTGLIWVLSKMMLAGKDYKVEWVDSQPIKPPYLMLSNHMHFVDFELAAMATFPYGVSNVVNIDGYINKFFLLEWIGAISTRKFTNDIHLVKSIYGVFYPVIVDPHTVNDGIVLNKSEYAWLGVARLCFRCN